MSVRRRLARASFWTFAGHGLQLLGGIAGSIAAARILGPAPFGELSMTRATLLTLTMLCGVSLVSAATRAIVAARAEDSERAGRVIGFFLHTAGILSGLAALACIVLARPIALQLEAPQLAPLIALSAPYIVFASLAAVQTGALQALDAFPAAARLLALEAVFSAIAIAIAAWAYGVTGAVVATVATAAIAFAVRQRALHRTCAAQQVVVRYRNLRPELALLTALIAPSLLYALAGQPFAWLARALLARNPNGLVEVGVFAAAYAWGTAVMQLPGQVTRPAVPILTSLLAAGQLDDYRRLMRDILLLSLGASVAVAAPLMIAAPWIMRAYGASFRHGALALGLVAASSIFASVSGALRSALLAAGATWSQTLEALSWGVVLAGSFLLMRNQGATGLAAAYLIAFAFAFAVQTALAIAAHRRALRT